VDEFLVKVCFGGFNEEFEDVGLLYWFGVVLVCMVFGVVEFVVDDGLLLLLYFDFY